jgi:hypothetical protein
MISTPRRKVKAGGNSLSTIHYSNGNCDDFPAISGFMSIFFQPSIASNSDCDRGMIEATERKLLFQPSIASNSDCDEGDTAKPRRFSIFQPSIASNSDCDRKCKNSLLINSFTIINREPYSQLFLARLKSHKYLSQNQLRYRTRKACRALREQSKELSFAIGSRKIQKWFPRRGCLVATK